MGIFRRDLLKWVGMMSIVLVLLVSFVFLILKVVEVVNRLFVIWLYMVECIGCSESLLRSVDFIIDSIIFDYINLEYYEIIMVVSGF